MKWGSGKGDKPTGVGGVSFEPSDEGEVQGAVDGVTDGVDAMDRASDEAGVGSEDDAAVKPVIVPAAVVAGTSDGSVPPKKGLGLFKPSAPKATKEPKVKAVKEPKAPKEPKEPKTPKAPKVKKAKVEEEISLPITVVIDFYLGITKEREAEQLARAQIEKNFDAPNASYLYTQRWRDGIAVEMQEGGGQSYLPEILAKLDEDPTAIVAVAMSNRFAQVRLDPDTKSLETLLLVANQEPPENAFIALPTRAMRPYDRRGSRVFMSGVALLAASSMAMVFAVGAFFIDTGAWALPYIAQTPVTALPMGQYDKITTTLQDPLNECIYKMEFSGGNWNIVAGHNSGGVCASGQASAAPEPVAPVDGDAVVDDDAAAPVMPGAPSPAGMPAVGTAPPVSPVTGAGGPPSAPTAPPVFGAPAGSPAGSGS